MSNKIICDRLQFLGYEATSEVNPKTQREQQAYVVNWTNDSETGRVGMNLPATIYKLIILAMFYFSHLVNDEKLYEFAAVRLRSLGKEEMQGFFQKYQRKINEEVLVATETGFIYFLDTPARAGQPQPNNAV